MAPPPLFGRVSGGPAQLHSMVRYVGPRHLITVAEELARCGVINAPTDFVEWVLRLRTSEAIASLLSTHDEGQAADGVEVRRLGSRDQERWLDGAYSVYPARTENPACATPLTVDCDQRSIANT